MSQGKMDIIEVTAAAPATTDKVAGKAQQSKVAEDVKRENVLIAVSCFINLSAKTAQSISLKFKKYFLS